MNAAILFALIAASAGPQPAGGVRTAPPAVETISSTNLLLEQPRVMKTENRIRMAGAIRRRIGGSGALGSRDHRMIDRKAELVLWRF